MCNRYSTCEASSERQRKALPCAVRSGLRSPDRLRPQRRQRRQQPAAGGWAAGRRSTCTLPGGGGSERTGVIDITASGFNWAPTGAWVGIGFGLGFLGAGATSAATAGGGGVPIQFVFNGSPAQRAGLQPGDTLVALDGHAVQSALEARRTLHGLAVGQTVQVTFRRAGAEQQMSITAEPAPSVRIATSSMVVPGIGVTMLADQKKILQDAMTQVTTACTSVDQYAAQHSDDAQAQARAKLCKEETDLTRQEMELGLKQLELQQQSAH